MTALIPSSSFYRPCSFVFIINFFHKKGISSLKTEEKKQQTNMGLISIQQDKTILILSEGRYNFSVSCFCRLGCVIVNSNERGISKSRSNYGRGHCIHLHTNTLLPSFQFCVKYQGRFDSSRRNFL